jgi:hypothetical protein
LQNSLRETRSQPASRGKTDKSQGTEREREREKEQGPLWFASGNAK